MIPIYKPYLEPYTKSAKEAIDSGWISNHGIYVNLATKELENLTKMKYCILMNNGTSATHCLFKALKFKYPELKKIYIPNYVFIAPYNCALFEYDEKNIEILKTDEKTMNMCVKEDYIMSLEPNSAIVIVHNLGQIVNVPRLKRLRPDIYFVEDNCEGFFGTYETLPSGSVSLCSSVSFYGNKTITTGEGGAFFTNDFEIYKYIKTFYSHGMSDIRYVHEIIGHNYRMTNIQGAFLYDQLKDINTILKKKKKIIETYKILLLPLVKGGYIEFLENEENTESSNWMFCAKFVSSLEKYETLERYLDEKQIQIRPFFYDAHTHFHLRLIKHTYKNEFLCHGFMLPSFPELSQSQQEYICISLQQYFNESKTDFEIINITEQNIYLLHDFLKNSLSPHFRYFNKRTPEKAIKNHVLTQICLVNKRPVGYAHLDYERDREIYWVGLCILDEKRGKGYGTRLLVSILSFSDKNKITTCLTVDTNNFIAISLYTKKGFIIEYENKEESYLRMIRKYKT